MNPAVDTSQPLLVLLSQGAVAANAEENGLSILANLSDGATATTAIDSTLPPNQGSAG